MTSAPSQPRTTAEPDDAPPAPGPWRRAVLWLAVWTLPGLLQCVQEFTWARSQGTAPDTLRLLAQFLPAWWPWALFTPWVLALTRRLPVTGGRWARHLPAHAAACLVLGCTHTLLLGLYRVHWPPYPTGAPELGDWLRWTLWSPHTQLEVLAYAAVVTVGVALDALHTARARAVRGARLEGQLARARLATLRGQLRPHFLFNTLNTIDVLIDEDAGRARRVLLHLSDLLRRSLDAPGTHEIRLADELAHLRCYLDIEALRFADRLTVRERVDADTLELAVPAFLLQPLVENAVRHGLAPRAAGGRIEVSARRDGDRLLLQVRDDGVGPGGASREGVGLSNTRARLAELHGTGASLVLEPAPGGGTLVSVQLPARAHTVEAA